MNFLNHFNINNGHLIVSDVDVMEIIDSIGTPLYLYDGNIIKNIYSELRDKLSSNINIHFALKANPNVQICRLLKEMGAGVEVVSEGELHIAKKAGFKSEDIIVNGPGKTNTLIQSSINDEVLLINIECFEDLYAINSASMSLGKCTDVVIRINPRLNSNKATIPTGGNAQKFGIDEEQISSLINKASTMKNINICGFHVFFGSQILDYAYLLNIMDNTVRLSNELSEKYKLSISFINLGGGIGVSYEKNFNIDKFCRGINKIVKKSKNKEIQYILELGRILTAESGIYLTKVLNTKTSNGKKFIITDGGINHAMLPITASKYPVYIVNKLNEDNLEKSYIGGPMCTSADLYPVELTLPNASTGDIVGMFYSGAYGFSASLLYFLSFPLPAEVLVINSNMMTIRRRGSVQDFLTHQ